VIVCPLITLVKGRSGGDLGELAIRPFGYGENVIVAEGQSQAEVWCRATLQAEAVGILARPTASTGREGF
jgi:hypothetical protein